MPREDGAQLGRYVIESLIGQGTRGDVYRARDQRLGRVVALKVLRPRPEGSSRPVVAAALREARAAAAVHHPNVTEVFDVDEADGEMFIVMEHVSGTSLRRLVGDGAVPLPRRIRWLCQIAAALEAAHACGVIHRDVKPENVLISEGGDVKVLDFGIARSPRAPSPAGHHPTPSSYNEIAGAPDYMAPEQARAEAVDGRADQFAWGVVAYELIAGASPWTRRQSPFMTLVAVLQDEPPPFPPEIGVPDPVAAAVRRALCKSPAARFASMGEVVDALLPFAERPRLSAGPGEEPAAPSSSPPAPETVVAYSSAVVTVAHHGPVLLTHWGSVPDLPSLRRVAEVQAMWMRRHDGKLGAVTFLEPAAGHTLSAEARDEAARMQRAAQGRVIAIATVVAETGFRASIVRSVLTGLARLSAQGTKESVFAAPADAADWLAQAMAEQGTRVDARALEQAIGAVRAAHARGAGPGP